MRTERTEKSPMFLVVTLQSNPQLHQNLESKVFEFVLKVLCYNNSRVHFFLTVVKTNCKSTNFALRVFHRNNYESPIRIGLYVALVYHYCHFYYMNRQQTFRFRLFENFQNIFFKRLQNTLKSRGKSQEIVSFHCP